jgi:hypothetical protein
VLQPMHAYTVTKKFVGVFVARFRAKCYVLRVAMTNRRGRPSYSII